MQGGSIRELLGGPHHSAYLVEDVEAAITEMVARFGAGPFFLIGNVPLEDVRSGGEPARLDHSSAFGSWGGYPIELMQVHRASPARVAARWSGALPRLHHVGYAVLEEARAAAVRADLESAGSPAYLSSRLGGPANSFHDTGAILGHDLEIQVDAPAFRDFFAMILGAAAGWDGSEPLREVEV